MPALFPLAQYWWLYAAFTGSVLVLLALDLGVFHREAHAVGAREAAVWSGVWVALAVALHLALLRYAPWALPRGPRVPGVAGALLLRSVFIALGSVLLHLRWVAWLFGAFLVLTGLKMMLAPAQGLDPGKNPGIRLFRSVGPVTPAFH